MDPRAPKIVLYDGVCNLCDRAVRFVLLRDPKGRFRFASLQGAPGKALLAAHHLPDPELPESLVLVEGDRVSLYSSAALRIAGGLAFPWNLAVVFLAVPRPIRDFIYRWIARNRYRWFGRAETCLLPRPEWRRRFLDEAGRENPPRD